MLNIFHKFYQKIFATRRFLQKRNDVHSPSIQRGHVEWVIARSLCHYRQFSLQDTPVQHRANILAQKIRQWSPFSQYDSYIVWRKHAALVWIWDIQISQHELNQYDLKDVRVRYIPETLLYPALNDGEQLYQCIEGVEGQVWQHQNLLASRWWPHPPTLTQWNSFLRTTHLANIDVLPCLQVFDLSQRAWGKSAKIDHSAILYNERLWVFLGMMCFAILLSWQGVYVWKLRQAITETAFQIQTINDEAIPILQARNEALAFKQKVDTFNTLVSAPSQLEIMSKTANSLPREATLQAWSYQKGMLKLTIEAKDIDPRFYIKKFQEHPLFYDVRSETGGNSEHIVMSMQVHTIQVD